MTTWLASDWHISHNNIIKFSNRPFADCQLMEQDCIRECTEKLKPGDRVIYLGDLHWSRAPHEIDTFLQKVFKPSIELFYLRGNHDYQVDKVRKLSDDHGRYRIKLIREIFEFQHGDEYIVCCHYPIFSWNKKRYGALHAFGHLHSKPEQKFGFGKSCDVGYDPQQRWLSSVEEFIGQVKERDGLAQPTFYDHHE